MKEPIILKFPAKKFIEENKFKTLDETLELMTDCYSRLIDKKEKIKDLPIEELEHIVRFYIRFNS